MEEETKERGETNTFNVHTASLNSNFQYENTDGSIRSPNERHEETIPLVSDSNRISSITIRRSRRRRHSDQNSLWTSLFAWNTSRHNDDIERSRDDSDPSRRADQNDTLSVIRTSRIQNRDSNSVVQSSIPYFLPRLRRNSSTSSRNGSTVGTTPTDNEISNLESGETSNENTVTDNEDSTSDDEDGLESIELSLPSLSVVISTISRYQVHLPFLLLLLIFLLYLHIKGILLIFFGTTSILALEGMIQTYSSKRDPISSSKIIFKIATCVVFGCGLYIIDKDTPYEFYVLKRYVVEINGSIWQVIWVNLINDFLIRLGCIIFKLTCLAIKWDNFRFNQNVTNQDPTKIYWRRMSFFKLIGLFVHTCRVFFPTIPWVAYYMFTQPGFVSNVFTFSYLSFKSFVLFFHAILLVRKFKSYFGKDCDYGELMSQEELNVSGNPDCPICYDKIVKAIKLECSHIFCEDCLREWCEREKSCPICRASTTTSGTSVLDNYFVSDNPTLVPLIF